MNGASMFSIEKCTVPAQTLLDRYLVNGAYADCYTTEVSGSLSLPEYIFSFYTTPLFKVERLILRFTVSKPSTDVQARQLGEGKIHKFAAWHVEQRSKNELLMCDFLERTRSWFKVIPIGQTRTQLYFGSAVSSRQNPTTGKLSLGFGFRALLGFHKIYSMLLLHSVRLRIREQQSTR
jgi:hypothetical protein